MESRTDKWSVVTAVVSIVFSAGILTTSVATAKSDIAELQAGRLGIEQRLARIEGKLDILLAREGANGAR